MISHLQRIQNYAARVILRFQKSSNITAHLKALHWLPVKVRSTKKIVCLCYRCHGSTAPSYVADIIIIIMVIIKCYFSGELIALSLKNIIKKKHVADMLQKKPSHTRNTRSSSYTMPLFNRPAHCNETLGDCSFPFASFVWNSIPNDVKCAPSLSSFMSLLKTYLFRSVYKE